MLQRLYSRPAFAKIAHFERDSWTNVSQSILDRLGSNLHMQPRHPLALVKERIREYFGAIKVPKVSNDNRIKTFFTWHDHTDPVVSVSENFDQLLFPPDHPGRSPSDTYYLNRHLLLRTHMTANEREILKAGYRAFLLAGDVYRRDEIDATHYPVFHQVEGVRVVDDPKESSVSLDLPLALREAIKDQPLQTGKPKDLVLVTLADLFGQLEGLLRHLFGPDVQIRWQPTYFPFTQPSFEAEVLFGGIDGDQQRWVEVLGAGILQDPILSGAIIKDRPSVAWAFGMGLERLAMILYGIPDIRLFWSKDPRFLDQFRNDCGSIIRYKAFSRFPPISRDLSFWINGAWEANDLYEIIRGIGGDLVENVQQVHDL